MIQLSQAACDPLWNRVVVGLYEFQLAINKEFPWTAPNVEPQDYGIGDFCE